MNEFFDNEDCCDLPVYFVGVEKPIHCSKFCLMKENMYFRTFFKTNLPTKRWDGNPTLPNEFHCIAKKVFYLMHGREPLRQAILDDEIRPGHIDYNSFIVLPEEMTLLVEFCNYLIFDVNKFPEFVLWRDRDIVVSEDHEDFFNRLDVCQNNEMMLNYFVKHFKELAMDKVWYTDGNYSHLLKNIVETFVKERRIASPVEWHSTFVSKININ